MSKNDILTVEEILKFEINPLIFNIIEKVKDEFDIDNHEVKILDWGCGRGRAVGKLKMLGYDAFGVDIDQNVLEKAQNAYEKLGIDSNCLGVIGMDNQSKFGSDFFHIIISEHVFEHVKKFDELLQELSRIQKLGGLSYHVFPAKFTPIEVHLRMPFVHYVPKGFFRRGLIYFWNLIGVEPKWDVPIKEKAKIYSNYSIRNTYYRNLTKINKMMRVRNFEMRYLTLENNKIRKKLNKIPFFRSTLLTPIIHFLIINFVLVHIETRKVR